MRPSSLKDRTELAVRSQGETLGDIIYNSNDEELLLLAIEYGIPLPAGTSPWHAAFCFWVERRSQGETNAIRALARCRDHAMPLVDARDMYGEAVKAIYYDMPLCDWMHQVWAMLATTGEKQPNGDANVRSAFNRVVHVPSDTPRPRLRMSGDSVTAEMRRSVYRIFLKTAPRIGLSRADVCVAGAFWTLALWAVQAELRDQVATVCLPRSDALVAKVHWSKDARDLVLFAMTNNIACVGIETPFVWLTSWASNDLTMALETLKLLLRDCPAGLNAADRYGRTALDYAVRADDTELVKALIRAGADCRAVPQGSGGAPGPKPMIFAAIEWRNKSVVELLLREYPDMKEHHWRLGENRYWQIDACAGACDFRAELNEILDRL